MGMLLRRHRNAEPVVTEEVKEIPVAEIRETETPQQESPKSSAKGRKKKG